METITPSCPDCSSDDLQALTIVTVLTRDPVYLWRDDAGNLCPDVQERDLADAEPIDSDHDGTRYVCGDCGYEGDPEEWSVEDNPDHPDHEEPEEDGPTTCPGCGGADLQLLGTLCSRTYMRCRDCGLDCGRVDPMDDPTL